MAAIDMIDESLYQGPRVLRSTDWEPEAPGYALGWLWWAGWGLTGVLGAICALRRLWGR